MAGIYISFYLKYYRIHVFTDVLRKMGSPERICFMLHESRDKLAIAPYKKHDFKAVDVPKEVYESGGMLAVSSFGLCNLLSRAHNWEQGFSYRAPGEVFADVNVAEFNLKEAVRVRRDDGSIIDE